MGGQRVGSFINTFIPPFNKRALFAVLDAPAKQCRNQLRRITQKIKKQSNMNSRFKGGFFKKVITQENHKGKFEALKKHLDR